MDWSYQLEEDADCPNGWCISICGVAAIPVVQTDGKHFYDERPDAPVWSVLCWNLHAFLPPTGRRLQDHRWLRYDEYFDPKSNLQETSLRMGEEIRRHAQAASCLPTDELSSMCMAKLAAWLTGSLLKLTRSRGSSGVLQRASMPPSLLSVT